MKKIPAIIAALVTTAVVVLAMLIMGVNAFFNPTSVQAASSPSSANTQAAASDTIQVSAAQVQQLQQRINEYQNREQQYQTQLNQAKQEIQQYQQLFGALQQMGILRVDQNGQIMVGRGFGDDH
jgi:peptidoglycan hydrolase CwlO-like protein